MRLSISRNTCAPRVPLRGREAPLTACLIELIHDLESRTRAQGWDALDDLADVLEARASAAERR